MKITVDVQHRSMSFSDMQLIDPSCVACGWINPMSGSFTISSYVIDGDDSNWVDGSYVDGTLSKFATKADSRTVVINFCGLPQFRDGVIEFLYGWINPLNGEIFYEGTRSAEEVDQYDDLR